MENSAAQLEVATLALTAILALWLGLAVLTRFPTVAARAFVLLALVLAIWCGATIVERLSGSAGVISAGRVVEELATGALLPAMVGLSLFIASGGHPRRWQLGLLGLAYILNVGLALPGGTTPGTHIPIGLPSLTLGLVHAEDVDTARIIVRLTTIITAIVMLLVAFRGTGSGSRRLQVGITLAAMVLAGAGGSLRVFDAVLHTDAWIGVSMISVSMILMASVVFSPGLFFAPRVATSAFWASLGTGVALFALVSVLLVVDYGSRNLLAVDAPLPTVFALVMAIALYEPAVGRARMRLRGRTPADLARDRLLRAIGPSVASERPAEADLQPALTRLAGTLGLAGVAVIRPDGSVAAVEGQPPDPHTASVIPLVAGNEFVGELRMGPRLSGEPLGARDEAIVRLSAAYAAAALQAGRREDEQIEAMADLARDRVTVESAAQQLHDAMVRPDAAAPGLRVFALGPLRVERGGVTVERWGGEKAGTRQALALFAFLLDRGERGVQKDEVLELIWPDIDIERADLAFHRTLGGLRHTLAETPERAKRVIRFQNDRYRLDAAVVEWSDAAQFEANLAVARQAADAGRSLALLESARGLYRGDYLDDCPFYGDSAFVEDRRASLRDRYVDLLVGLGERYEAGGDRASAAAAFREASGLASDRNSLAGAGLARVAAGG